MIDIKLSKHWIFGGCFLALGVLVTALFIASIDAAPTAPTSMTCNGNECSGDIRDSVDVLCSGSTDAEDDAITYSYEALYSSTVRTSCGTAQCMDGEICIEEGVCACGGTGPTCLGGMQICCGTKCLYIKEDPENCGGCGITCSAEQRCIEGQCVYCTVEEFMSGSCNPSYGSMPSDAYWHSIGTSWDISQMAEQSVYARCRVTDSGSNAWSNYLLSSQMSIKEPVPAILDEDNDGIEDAYDLCSGTVAELASLRPQHYADVDSDGIFETFSSELNETVDANFESKTLGTLSPLTLAHTKGCNCLQITLQSKSTAKVQEKIGCTKNQIEDWIKLNA